MVMWIVFGVLAPLLILGLVAAGIVGLLRGRLTFATVVHAYTVVVLGVCVILALNGGALLLKATFGEVISRDFSYQAANYSPRPAPGATAASQRAPSEARADTATGVTLLAIGLS